MANRPILDIEVNDSEFTEFLKKWEDYKAQAAAMPQSWMSVNYEITNLKTRFEKILETLEGQNRKTSETIDSQSKFAKILDAAEVTAFSVGASGKHFAHNIHQSTLSLMKWVKLTSVFSGLLGAGGLYGIDRMAMGVASRRTEATGLGVSIGEQSAFEAAFARLGNPKGILQGFSEGLATPVGKAQIAHLLGHAPTGDAAETAIEALPKFKEFLAHTAHDQWKAQIEAFGYEKLGLGVPEANIISKMTPEEVAAAQKSFRDNRQGLNLDPDTARKWTDFQQQLDFAGGQLQKVFAAGLVKLAPGLEHLSDAFVNLVDSLLKDGSPIKKWIGSLGEGIKKFAEHMESKSFQQHVSEFVKDSKNAVELINTMVSNAPGGISALIGMLIAARYAGSAAVALGAGLGRTGLAGAIARYFPEAAGVGAIYETIKPQPLNEGEDERARQQKYGTTPNAPAGPRTQTPGSAGGGATPKVPRSVREGFGPGTSGTATPGTRTDIQSGARTPSVATSGSVPAGEISSIADSASALAGRPVLSSEVQQYLSETGRGHPSSLWCADFVGSALEHAGYKSMRTRVATDYLKFGQSIKWTDIKRGDVIVEGRHRTTPRIGGLGHVGIASGPPEKRGGKWVLPEISGDYNNRVELRDWADPSTAQVRRPVERIDARRGVGTHPAKLGKATTDVQIDNQAGSLVSVH